MLLLQNFRITTLQLNECRFFGAVRALATHAENAAFVAAVVGNAAVIPCLDAAGVFGQPRFAFAQVDEVHSRASGKAAALAHQRAAYACGVIDPFALRTADQLYKSLAVACGDRKYFSSTLGSKMSISDNVDAFPVLRNAVEA